MNQRASIDIKIGRTYRAKRPAPTGGPTETPLVNDRTIVWVGVGEVQYDSPAVPPGRRLPRVTTEAFLRWADRDVTDELPVGQYMEWKQLTNPSRNASA